MEDTHDRASQLLAGYSLGALDDAEEALVEEHLEEGCVDCEEEAAALRDTAHLLPLGAPSVHPPPSLRAHVLSAATATPVHAPTSVEAAPRAVGGGQSGGVLSWLRPLRFSTMAASAAVLVATGLLAWGVVLQTQIDDLQGENVALAAQLADTSEQLSVAAVAAEQATSSTIATLITMSSGESQVLNLAGATDGSAQGRLIWDQNTGRYVLVVDGLTPTRDGEAYVLWSEGADGPRKVGEFYVDENGGGILHGYLNLDGEDAISVTRESQPDTVARPSQPVLLSLR